MCFDMKVKRDSVLNKTKLKQGKFLLLLVAVVFNAITTATSSNYIQRTTYARSVCAYTSLLIVFPSLFVGDSY